MRASKPGFLRTVFGLLMLAIVNLIANRQAFGASESILWNFGKGTDGANPSAGLIMDTSGNLYGTTADGGTYATTSFQWRNGVQAGSSFGQRGKLDRVDPLELWQRYRRRRTRCRPDHG